MANPYDRETQRIQYDVYRLQHLHEQQAEDQKRQIEATNYRLLIQTPDPFKDLALAQQEIEVRNAAHQIRTDWASQLLGGITSVLSTASNFVNPTSFVANQLASGIASRIGGSVRYGGGGILVGFDKWFKSYLDAHGGILPPEVIRQREEYREMVRDRAIRHYLALGMTPIEAEANWVNGEINDLRGEDARVNARIAEWNQTIQDAQNSRIDTKIAQALSHLDPASWF